MPFRGRHFAAVTLNPLLDSRCSAAVTPPPYYAVVTTQPLLRNRYTLTRGRSTDRSGVKKVRRRGGTLEKISVRDHPHALCGHSTAVPLQQPLIHSAAARNFRYHRPSSTPRALRRSSVYSFYSFVNLPLGLCVRRCLGTCMHVAHSQSPCGATSMGGDEQNW